MRKEIHPEYYPQAKVTCSCGNEFVVGATVPEFRVDICSACHPLYTGKKKLVDTAGRVERFQSRLEHVKAKQKGDKS
jgi:large subunit ribosomal protein L31